MLLPAIVVTAALLLAAFAIFGAFMAAQKERQRQRLEAILKSRLQRVEVDSPEAGRGFFHDIEVQIRVDEHQIQYDFTLPPAIAPYTELVDHFADAQLRADLETHCLHIEPPSGFVTARGDTTDTGLVTGALSPSGHLEDDVTAVLNRLPLVRTIRDLRDRAPALLVDQVLTLGTTTEVDDLLWRLSRYFPDAPETQQAITLAKLREPGRKVSRIADRTDTWLNPVA